MNINVFLALRSDAQQSVVTRLTWNEEVQGEYTGPVTDRQAKLFRYMADRETTQALFRNATIGAFKWTLWSVYFPLSLGSNVLQIIQDELDNLAVTYPTQFIIVGAWRWDGRQVGTRWNSDRTDVTGTPTYPIHPRLIDLMPDEVTYDAEGNEVSRVRPTGLSDVNLLLGQSPRRFT